MTTADNEALQDYAITIGSSKDHVNRKGTFRITHLQTDTITLHFSDMLRVTVGDKIVLSYPIRLIYRESCRYDSGSSRLGLHLKHPITVPRGHKIGVRCSPEKDVEICLIGEVTVELQ